MFPKRLNHASVVAHLLHFPQKGYTYKKFTNKMIMGNRGEGDREAIADSMEAIGKIERKATFSSRYVYKSEGVPNDPDVIAAIDAWADVWGNEVTSLVNNEGILNMEDPAQKAASEHLADKAD